MFLIYYVVNVTNIFKSQNGIFNDYIIIFIIGR